MGYLHISNLYRATDILLFKRCYATEKVHGTSAHIGFRQTGKSGDGLRFFSGGESHEKFVNLFDQNALIVAFVAIGREDVTVFGEAYGGKQQGMSRTYGPELRFIAFDVKIDDNWLSVPDAKQICDTLGIEFVPYEEVSTDLAELDRVRDLPSEVAIRRGMGNDKHREGVVLRPLVEVTKNNGDRIIAKHKGAAFEERAHPPKVIDASKLEVLAEAEAIAQEWVHPVRLQHVLQKIAATDMKDTPKVIAAMIEDVYREAAGEIVESKDAKTAIGKRTAKLFKEHLTTRMRETNE